MAAMREQVVCPVCHGQLRYLVAIGRETKSVIGTGR